MKSYYLTILGNILMKYFFIQSYFFIRLFYSNNKEKVMEKKIKKTKKRNSSGLFLKLIVLGDSGVGKTCLINRYVGGNYQDTFTPTLGVDFKVKTVEKNDIKVDLQIWDTAGQQRFKTLTKSYFQGCLAVLLIFSLTDISSFSNIEKWITQLQQHADSRIVKILVGTKVDSPDERVVQVNQCSQIALKYDIQYFQVSSKTGYNIDNVFEGVIEKIMKKNHSQFSRFFPSKSIKLGKQGEQQSYLKRCEC